MALELLHVVKRPTFLELDSGVTLDDMVAGKLAAVNTSAKMVLAGDNSAVVIGVVQADAKVPDYESDGILRTQINGAVGSPGGGTRVSTVAGAGSVLATDQVSGLGGLTPGDQLGSDSTGKFKKHVSGNVVALLLKKDATTIWVQLRL